MSVMVPIAMFGWVPLTLLLFTVLPARRAVLVSFIGGWLLLPVASYSFAGLPDYTKISATCLSVLLGVVLFDAQRLLQIRFSFIDIPIVIWCLVPLPSGLAAGLGPYHAVSAVLNQTITWGVPYLIGRAYFNDAESRRELLTGLVLGGMLYVPLCWYEIRMSPKLHYQVYGYIQHVWAQTIRYGGWRPMVFLQHGLALGAWMMSASVAALWLWRTRPASRIHDVPIGWLAAVLVVTTVACKSTGSILLMLLGIGAVLLSRWNLTRLAVLGLALTVPAYMAGRTLNLVTADDLVSLVRPVLSEARVGSFRGRLEQEDVLAAHAMARPLLGWGPWGDFRVSLSGESLVKATDGLWIITLGKYGLIGLAALSMTVLLPALRIATETSPALRGPPRGSAEPGLALLLVLFLADNLMNANPNPLFAIIMGGIGYSPVFSRSHQAARSTDWYLITPDQQVETT